MIIAPRMKSKEDGAALVVALVMLALVTLLAAVSSTAVQTNLKIVQNIESRAMAVNSGLSGLEQILAEGDITAFDGAVLYFDASGDGVAGTELRVQTGLACITLRPVEGLQVYDPNDPTSALADGCTKECDPFTGVCTSTDCADVLWEVDVDALDTLTGAQATIRQGLEVRSDVNATTSC